MPFSRSVPSFMRILSYPSSSTTKSVHTQHHWLCVLRVSALGFVVNPHIWNAFFTTHLSLWVSANDSTNWMPRRSQCDWFNVLSSPVCDSIVILNEFVQAWKWACCCCCQRNFSTIEGLFFQVLLIWGSNKCDEKNIGMHGHKFDAICLNYSNGKVLSFGQLNLGFVSPYSLLYCNFWMEI